MRLSRKVNGIALFLTLAIALPAIGQQKPSVELGGQILGVTTLLESGERLTVIGLPGAGLTGQSMLYASFFPSEALIVEPEFSFWSLSSDGETLSVLSLTGQLAYLFNGAARSSPYVSGHASVLRLSGDGDSDSTTGAGAGLGFRGIVRQYFSFRIEGRYRRWFDSDTNELSLLLTFGGIFQ